MFRRIKSKNIFVEVKTMADAVDFSFNASGWMMLFQLGVLQCLQEKLDLKEVKSAGTSCGSIVAVCTLCGISASNIGEVVCRKELICRKDFKLIIPLMVEALKEITPENATEICNKRLGVACTEWTSLFPMKIEPIEFGHFENKPDLIEAIRASSHVPLLAGYGSYVYKLRCLYDGLFTDTHPHSNDPKVFKCSWTSECACGCTLDTPHNKGRSFFPSVNFPLRWCMLPPDDLTLRLIFYHGYARAHEVISRKEFPSELLKKQEKKTPLVCEESTESIMEKLKHTPLKEADALCYEQAVLCSSEIEAVLKKKVNDCNLKWTGWNGLYRCVAVAAYLLLPFLPIKKFVQSVVLSGR
jgi:hypothetical protein